MGKERDLEIVRGRVRDCKIGPWEKESSRQREKARLKLREGEDRPRKRRGFSTG